MAVSALKNVSQCSTKNEDGVSEENEEEDILLELEFVKVCMKLSTASKVEDNYK